MNSELLEDYPSSFSMEEFKKLNSFASRLKYAETHLQKLGSGSARTVYKIDDAKVLKLAKNPKGIAQNEKEASQSNDYYLKNIVADTFDYHPDFHWIEMEYAQKLKPTTFKKLTRIDIKDFDYYLKYKNDQIRGRGRFTFGLDQNLIDSLDENEFAQGIVDYMANYGIPPGDLGRLSSYGVVKRNGEDTIVLIDYGLDDDIYKQFYAPKISEHSEIRKVVRKVVEEVFNEEEQTYSGEEVNEYIKGITPDEEALPTWFMNVLIEPRTFKKTTISIDELLKSDESFKEYFDGDEYRYSSDEVDPSDLYNYVTVVDGKVMDGYNRMSVLKRNGQNKADAFVAI